MIDDPYRTLQVDPGADSEAIRAAYRRLARLYHPDRNPRPEAAAQMRAINAAYGLLSDPRRRAAYDARRYFRPTAAPVGVPHASRPMRRAVVVTPPVSQPPTALQRRVDRLVAVLGVLLLIAIGFYVINVIPYAERQIQADRRALGASERRPRPSDAATAQTASLADSEHVQGAAVPDRLSSDVGLRSFPGTVLVAPLSLPPFSSLPVFRLDATGQGIARYAVYYGDLTSGGATISGLVGRSAFDAAEPHLSNCVPDAAYCAGLAPGQPTNADAPGYELFRPPDLLADNPMFVTHRVCCNGVFWTVSWYEPRANMSYTIDLSRSIAARYGRPAAERDVSAARAVAGLASQLVRLP